MDIFFFFIFSLTSILIWLPIFALLYLPFYLLRRIKRVVSLFTLWMSNLSELGLQRLSRFRELVKAATLVEKQGKSLFNNMVHRFYKQTVWWTRFEILQEVPKRAKVLDIGCGNGYLAKLIIEARDAEVTCVDVVDYNETDLETVLYDGVNLPFFDKSFDIVILSYVLHHSEVVVALLKEAERVCRGKVIIYEDEVPILQSFMAKAHEITYNWLYDMDSPVTYWSRSNWEETFMALGFSVDQAKSEWQIGALTKPVKKVVYVLKPRKI